MGSKSSSSKPLTLNVILIGPPACGKGTQANHLIEEYGVKQFSTGDILRNFVKSGSEEAQSLKTIMSSGGLVPDDTILKLLAAELITHKKNMDSKKKRDRRGGFLLDGFPRTLNQGKMVRLISVKSLIMTTLKAQEIFSDLI